MTEFGHKMKEEMKATPSDIKQNIQGTHSERKEMGTQTNGLDQKEKINNQPKQNEEARIQKMRRGLGTSRKILYISKSES